MAISIAPLQQRLTLLNQQRNTPSLQPNWLLDTLPTHAEWQTSTKARVGRRGGNNPELLQIDAALTAYQTGINRGVRAKAIKDIKAIIGRWRTRRGVAAATSERHAAMQTLEQIIDELIRLVVYDNNAFINKMRGESRPTSVDMVKGGFSENGPTTEACRLHCINDFFAVGKTSAVFDTMNEARDALNRNGLAPGAAYTGGGACHSAQDWAILYAPEKVKLLDGSTYTFRDLAPVRNSNDTHRFLRDKKGVIFDPTWRQFQPGLKNTPGIFAGTVKDLETIVATAGGVVENVAGRYS